MLPRTLILLSLLFCLLSHVYPQAQDRDYLISTLERINFEVRNNYKLGNFVAAAERALKAIELSTQVFGRDHGETAICYYNYAEILVSQRKFDNAVEAYTASINILKRVAPNDIPRISRFVERKATVLALDDKRTDAENLFNENIVFVEEKFGRGDIRTLPALLALTKYYIFTEQREKADDLFLKQYEIVWRGKEEDKKERENLDDERLCFTETKLNESQQKASRKKFDDAFYAIFPERRKQHLESNPAATGSVINGKAISLPRPEYPELARANKLTGLAIVRVLIDERGYVISAKMICGHSVFRNSVETAASSAKFSPTLLSNQPVKVSGLINYKFVR